MLLLRRPACSAWLSAGGTSCGSPERLHDRKFGNYVGMRHECHGAHGAAHSHTLTLPVLREVAAPFVDGDETQYHMRPLTPLRSVHCERLGIPAFEQGRDAAHLSCIQAEHDHGASWAASGKFVCYLGCPDCFLLIDQRRAALLLL